MKKNNILILNIVFYIFLLIILLIFLSRITLFEYQQIMCTIKDKSIEILTSKSKTKNITRNTFLYYKGKKYFYKIDENLDNDNLSLLKLTTYKKVTTNKIDNIYIPKRKVSLGEILIKSWRLD